MYGFCVTGNAFVRDKLFPALRCSKERGPPVWPGRSKGEMIAAEGGNALVVLYNTEDDDNIGIRMVKVSYLLIQDNNCIALLYNRWFFCIPIIWNWMIWKLFWIFRHKVINKCKWITWSCNDFSGNIRMLVYFNLIYQLHYRGLNVWEVISHKSWVSIKIYEPHCRKPLFLFHLIAVLKYCMADWI